MSPQEQAEQHQTNNQRGSRHRDQVLASWGNGGHYIIITIILARTQWDQTPPSWVNWSVFFRIKLIGSRHCETRYCSGEVTMPSFIIIKLFRTQYYQVLPGWSTVTETNFVLFWIIRDTVRSDQISCFVLFRSWKVFNYSCCNFSICNSFPFGQCWWLLPDHSKKGNMPSWKRRFKGVLTSCLTFLTLVCVFSRYTRFCFI